MNHPRVLMIFLDGVGIGKKDLTVNPFFTAKLPALSKLLDGNIPYLHAKNFYSDAVSLKKLNATLSVEGLPQSGTGQTSLLCGVNAAKIIGKHFGPYPYSSLRKIIEEKNIFKGDESKTRRILEIQDDEAQKLRKNFSFNNIKYNIYFVFLTLV